MKKQKKQKYFKIYLQEEADHLFRKICYNLDVLSNFHYTPKPVINEIEIKTNAPALNLEENIPLSYSMANQKAPEEVMERQKKELKDDKELTAEERHKNRENKKAIRRKERKEKKAIEKIVERVNPGLGNKYSKEKLREALSQRNVIEGKESNTTTTSTALFNQLQDELHKTISGFKGDEPPKKKRKNNQAAALKL